MLIFSSYLCLEESVRKLIPIFIHAIEDIKVRVFFQIKLLAQLEELFVYFSPCENPKDIEFKMLLYFIEHVSDQSLYELNEVGRYLPFANLTADFDKIHTIQHPVHKS